MDTSSGLQGPVVLLVAVGAAALTFVVPRPRLLWASLLAAVCGFFEGQLGTVWDVMFGTTAPGWPLLLTVVLLGAGYGWRVAGWRAISAGWLGIPWGLAVTVGVYWGLPRWNWGESYYGYWALGFSMIGVVLTIVGAGLTVALRVLIRRLRS